MTRWSRVGFVTTLSLLVVITILLGIVLHPLAVDDAFITYRYAYNLSTGQEFVYNPGEPILSTTTPLYALLLTAGALIWSDLPSLANVLSAIALGAAALLLFVLGRREKSSWVGALAAWLFVTYPLLWLSLGLETAVFLVLAIAAIITYRKGQLTGTAALLALATLTRGDGLLLTAVVASDYGLSWWTKYRKSEAHGLQTEDAQSASAEPKPSLRIGLVAILVYVGVMLPLLVWLTWQFGSPLPATLAAKRAQSELGVTGFYAHTTYLQGLGILARARLTQSPLYALFIPAILAGLVAMWKRARWVRLIAAWGAAHLLGYSLLGVTPYYWYYAPLVPALVCSAALGIVESVRWGSRRLGVGRLGTQGLVFRGAGGLWAAVLLVALVTSDWAMVEALDGPVPPPEDLVSKVLPEAKVGVYREAGEWLRDHTPPTALVGVTEVGVMGYYARRPMVDFLGLLEPEVAEALRRGDLYWALLRYQPEYLALTAVSPMYAYDVRADPWFQATYVPLQSFENPRFWGSPVTIYERRVDRVLLVEPAAEGLPANAIHLGVDFGGQIRLLGTLSGEDRVQPGDVLALTLYWQALGVIDHDYTVFVHLLGEYERVIAQRDAPPGLGAHPTSDWQPGQVVADPYLLALPEAAYTPDQAVWEIGLYDTQTGQRLPTADGGDNARFGKVSVLPAAEPLDLDFGIVALTGYELDRLALSAGETLHVTLQWEGEEAAQVTLQLVGEAGNMGAQVTGTLAQKVYALTLGAEAPPGVYDLELLVADPAAGQRQPLLGADGQPQSDRARLTNIRLYP